MAAYTHRVRLHFRSLCLTDIDFQTLLRNAERVYGQYGIKIEYASGQSLNLSPEQSKRYARVDGTCEWRITAGEFREVQGLGGAVPLFDIVVVFVREFQQAVLGCGGHAPDRPGCIVAAGGTQWTMPHEVGHVLLTSSFSPVHSTDTRNLMYAPTSGITAPLPVLDDRQLAQIKRSPCCSRC